MQACSQLLAQAVSWEGAPFITCLEGWLSRRADTEVNVVDKNF